LAVDAAFERGLEPVGQAAVSERPAGALGGAQALVRGLGVVRREEGGPVGDEVEQWTRRLPLRPASVPLREASIPPASASELEFHRRALANYWTAYPLAVMQAVKAWP
jgi:hypothetical protein